MTGRTPLQIARKIRSITGRTGPVWIYTRLSLWMEKRGLRRSTYAEQERYWDSQIMRFEYKCLDYPENEVCRIIFVAPWSKP